VRIASSRVRIASFRHMGQAVGVI